MLPRVGNPQGQTTDYNDFPHSWSCVFGGLPGCPSTTYLASIAVICPPNRSLPNTQLPLVGGGGRRFLEGAEQSSAPQRILFFATPKGAADQTETGYPRELTGSCYGNPGGRY